jgi:O-antigen/teichoic acid export membrane protein
MHWGRVFRNACSNGGSYLTSAVVGFVLAPVVVHSLGDAGYGLWTLILSLTGYFGLLDLGIRSSVGRFVTRYLALGDQDHVNRVASTALLILGGGGLVALVATFGIAAAFLDSFGLDSELAASGRLGLILAGLNISLILPLSLFSSLLIARERFDLLGAISIGGELLRAVLVVLVLRSGLGLVGLATTALAVTALQYSAIAIAARALYPDLRLAPRYVSGAVARTLFGFSIYRFVWIVANQLIFYSDTLVIGLFLGAAAITPYAIAASLLNYGRNIISLLTDTLAPAAAQLDARDDRAGLRRLLLTGTRLTVLVSTPLCVGYLALGRQFLSLWMGDTYAGSATLLMVLTIPQFGSLPQHVSALVLAGMAKHRVFALFALVEGVANVALSILLVQRLGLIGVALGTVITHLLCTTILVPLYTLSVLGMRAREYLVHAFWRPTVAALPMAVVGYQLWQVEPVSWWMFLGEAVVLCAVYGISSYFICFDARERATTISRMHALLHRQAVAHES